MAIRSTWIGGALAMAGLVAGCGSGGGSSTLSQQDLITKVKPTVVELPGQQGHGTVGGSGVVIDAKRGLVLTADHVVAGVSALKVKVGDNAATAGPARVLAAAARAAHGGGQMVNPRAGLKQATLGTSAKVKSGE